MKFRDLLIGLAAAAMLTLGASAQTYPFTSPTYIPNASVNAVTLTAPGDYTFNANGVGSATVRFSALSGTMTAAIQGTNDGTNWTTLCVMPVVAAGVAESSITGNDYVGFNTGGMTAFRAHVTALATASHHITIRAVASPGGNPSYVASC